MRRWLIFLLSFLIFLPMVKASEGIELVEIEQGSISQVVSNLEAKIENRGFHKVFVALPSDWSIDEDSYDVHSYPVREHGLWRIYGMPYSKTSMLGRGEVFTGKGPEGGYPYKGLAEVNGQKGWWLKPNEGIHVKIKLTLSTSGGEIDPNNIEDEYPYIKVVKWIQDFELTVSKAGIIKAPWVVKGATLTSASPAPYGDVRKTGGKLYYGKVKPEKKIKKWNEWIFLSEGLASKLKVEPSVDYEIKKDETLKPVWKLDTLENIYYEYEWYRDRKVEGVTLWRNDFEDTPAWFEWF